MAIEEIRIIESPRTMLEGETVTYTVTWLGASTLSSPTAVVYRSGTDITSTAMTTGTNSVSGNVQTLQGLTAISGDGGKKYVVIIQCVVDGNTERRKMIVDVVKASDE